MGFPILLDLPLNLQVRRKLVRKLLVTNDSAGLPLRQLAYQLLLISLQTGDRKDSLYCFDQACRRRFYFDARFSERLEIFAYRTLLRIPAQWIELAYRVVKKRALTSQVRQDRIARL